MKSLVIILIGFGTYGIFSFIENIVRLISDMVTDKRFRNALTELDKKYMKQLDDIDKKYKELRV